MKPSLIACLVFAVFAAILAALWIASAASFFGYADATAICVLALVVLYPLFVAPRWKDGIDVAIIASGPAVFLACLRPPPFAAFFLASLLLGATRSTLLYPRLLRRALVLESGLTAAGLGAASLFDDGRLAGTVFAVWAFWLIQAAFALWPVATTPRNESTVDPFERAHAAAVAILEQRRR